VRGPSRDADRPVGGADRSNRVKRREERSVRLRRFLGWVALVCWVATLASPARAQYAPTEAELTVSATVADPGDPLTLSGDGFCPATPVTVTAEPEQGGAARTLESGAVDTEGRFSSALTLPKDLSPGDYWVRAAGQDRDCLRPRVLGVRISVEEPRRRAMPLQPPFPSRKLLGLLVTGAAALLVVATPLLLAARRRRRRADRTASGPGSPEPPE
jgi:hypothetical protein